MPSKNGNAKLSAGGKNDPAERSPLLDPATGDKLEQKTMPGYYPGYRTLDQQNYWDAATRDLILKRVHHQLPIRFFTAGEAATMRAVADRILPQDDRASDTRIPILPGVDERLYFNRIEGYRYEDMPSDQDAYRLAMKAIEAMAQELHHKPFHMLLTLEQETILQSLHDGEPLASKAYGNS